MNRKVTKVSMFLLVTILVGGTVGWLFKSFENLYEREYYDHSVKKSFDMRVMNDEDSKSTNVQELKCFNVDVSVNWVDFHKHTKGFRADAAATTEALQGEARTEENGLFDMTLT